MREVIYFGMHLNVSYCTGIRRVVIRYITDRALWDGCANREVVPSAFEWKLILLGPLMSVVMEILARVERSSCHRQTRRIK